MNKKRAVNSSNYMKKLHFTIQINAPKEKVWHVMLDDATYRQWTEAFNKGSYYKGDWTKGSKILFMGPDPSTGKEGGMVSRIAESKPYEYVSIEHVGILSDGVEDTTSEFAKKWTPAFENYTFEEHNGITTLRIDVDSADELAAEFERMWPEALKSLKVLAESK
jgi:hypothetical protein